jgi:hypothetical protein
MKSGVPVVLLLLAACGYASLGCRSSDRAPTDAARGARCPRPHRVADVYDSQPGWEPRVVLGAAVDVREYGCPCRLELSWQSSEARAWDFRVNLAIVDKKGFPLPEGMVALDQCTGIQTDSQGHTDPPFADLDLEPAAGVVALAPVAGDVFIPIGGEATLEGSQHAVATMDSAEDAGGGEGAVTIVLSAPFRSDEPHRHFHETSTFAWGTSLATVVRVIEPSAEVVGWVEVRLSEVAPPG